MFVVGCWLLVVGCLLFVVCVGGVLYVVCCLLFAVVVLGVMDCGVVVVLCVMSHVWCAVVLRQLL